MPFEDGEMFFSPYLRGFKINQDMMESYAVAVFVYDDCWLYNTEYEDGVHLASRMHNVQVTAVELGYVCRFCFSIL